jgi:hypothetical protein
MAAATAGPTASPARRSTRRYLDRFPGAGGSRSSPPPPSSSPASPRLIPTRRHGRPSSWLRAPAAATAAAATLAVTPGPPSGTSRTASASRPGRANDAATRSAGRTSRPTNPRNSGRVRTDPPPTGAASTPGSCRPGPRPPGAASTPGPCGSGPRRGSVADRSGGCRRLSTPPVRDASRATRLRPSKAAWWQATARRVPPEPTATRKGGWTARSKRSSRPGACSGSPSTIRGSGGGPGCQVSPWRRAPVMGTAWWSDASRFWSESTGPARVAAATTTQAVRRSGKRSRARALAEAGAGNSGRVAIAGPPGRAGAHPDRFGGGPGRGRSGSRARPGGRSRPGGGTRGGGASGRRSRGGGGSRRSGGCG